jgi:hypothetical protein
VKHRSRKPPGSFGKPVEWHGDVLNCHYRPTNWRVVTPLWRPVCAWCMPRSRNVDERHSPDWDKTVKLDRRSQLRFSGPNHPSSHN